MYFVLLMLLVRRIVILFLVLLFFRWCMAVVSFMLIVVLFCNFLYFSLFKKFFRMWWLIVSGYLVKALLVKMASLIWLYGCLLMKLLAIVLLIFRWLGLKFCVSILLERLMVSIMFMFFVFIFFFFRIFWGWAMVIISDVKVSVLNIGSNFFNLFCYDCMFCIFVRLGICSVVQCCQCLCKQYQFIVGNSSSSRKNFGLINFMLGLNMFMMFFCCFLFFCRF